MAGTGSGLLQPTKLVQTDDFMESIAPPGYQQYYSAAIAAVTDHALFTVPDGMSCEVIDFGLTVLNTPLVDTAATTETTLTFTATTESTAIVVMVAAAITGGGGVGTVTVAEGATISVLRKNAIPASGDLGWVFSPAALAQSNIYGPGTAFYLTLADEHGSGATGEATIWVRLKWTAKDNDSV